MSRKRLLILAPLLLALVGLCNVIYLEYDASPRSWPTLKFDSREWKALSEEKRFVFYKDLASSGLLADVNRAQVEELLGEPSGRAANYYAYIVKHAEPGEFSINFIYMSHIEFGSNGLVSDYYSRAD